LEQGAFSPQYSYGVTISLEFITFTGHPTYPATPHL